MTGGGGGGNPLENTLKREPAPHNSLAFPLHAWLQSVAAVSVPPLTIAFPQTAYGEVRIHPECT